MKLKKLELTGFKSFPEKATIEFPAGISAIVGPNGCGKSNIVDALRWVMGEQSVKQLRGKSMEDVIFAGANGKSSSNMAEVSLTLSNDNGTAPEEFKDFTEIMLTRRLYRSGERAYLLNKQPCRLKDIHNIFLGSGMGAKSYAVIQQGNIGAITDAGPEQRRFFIEEAAGITRFKVRKDEALRKVQSTNQNLLRISDIIAEVQRQMKSLKHQARKAERYKNYQHRIQNLDIRLALYYYDNFTHKIEQSDRLLSELQDKDLKHKSQLKRLDAAVEEITVDRWRKNHEISTQKARKFELQRNLDRSENDLAHLRNDVERLTREITALDTAHTELEEKNANIKSELNQLQREITDLEAEIRQVRTTLDQEGSASRRMRDELAALYQALDTLKSNLFDLTAQEAKYKNIYQTAENNRESLNRRLKRIDEEEILANKKLDELTNRQTRASEDLEAYRQEIEDLGARIDSMKKQLEVESRSLGQSVKRVQTLELDRKEHRSRYAALKKMDDNFEWYQAGVRAIMKNAKEENHAESSQAERPCRAKGGIIGLMADIIAPDPTFEIAVEAALGESLQYILVKDQETGQDAISYLHAHGAGRSGFIPVSAVRTPNRDSAIGSGLPNRLLDHVSVTAGFENVTEALLGHVHVARNLDEAATIWNSNGIPQTVVTKDGDVISHQGVMMGGSRDNLGGILAKKLEINELARQIETLDAELESAHKEQHNKESEVRTLEIHLQQLIEEQNIVSQKEMEAEKALYKATADTQNAHRHFEIVRLEQERILGEASDIDDEITRNSSALLDIENEIKSSQQRVAETSARIDALSLQMEDFNQRSVDLKLKLTNLTAKLESGENTLRRLSEFHEDGTKRLEQLFREIEQKTEKRIKAIRKITAIKQSLSAMYEDLKGLEQVLESSETDYHAIDQRLKQNDHLISKLQNEREETLRKIGILELEQSQRQMKRENIANRIQERYQQPLAGFRLELANSSTNPIQPVEEMEKELSRCRKRLSKIGDVNLGAIKEYETLQNRFEFLVEQRDDLVKAVEDLHRVIRKINRITKERFMKTFDLINEKLNEVFPRLFEGGSARLILTQPENPIESGVEFMIHPPGKKLTRLSLLSGGEKALSAIAFIFSIFLIKPASFCLLDEIDAPLDESNVFRFNDLLHIIGKNSQVIMITHNRKSMEFADMLFGVTMEKKGVSKLVAVNLQRATEQGSSLRLKHQGSWPG